MQSIVHRRAGDSTHSTVPFYAMHTREIARHLAEAASAFPWLGPISEEGLMNLVSWELGHEDILDRYQEYDSHFSRAIAPRCILHIISGNTPHAGLQSLIRGLLLGSNNYCKLPSGGLSEMDQFRDRLPFELARRVEYLSEVPGDWLERADAVIVFGSDETIDYFRVKVRADQKFIAHGHRLSFGVIFDDPELLSVSGAARDASLFDQQGCLSPHVFYVPASSAHSYAEALAEAMEMFDRSQPRRRLTVGEETEIATLRQEFAFRAATESEVAVWQSENSTAWTVLLDPDPRFTASCLNRVVFVKPLPDDLNAALLRVRTHLSTAGVYPLTAENVSKVDAVGVTRICPVGKMQAPPPSWHHDGLPVLGSLVTWVDVEQT